MRLHLAAALLAATIAPAAAGTRSLVIPAGAMGSSSGAPLALPDATSTTFPVSILLPADFKKDSIAKLRLSLVTVSGSACAVVIGGDLTTRFRNGQPFVLGPAVSVGLPDSAAKAVTLQGQAAMTLSYTLRGMTTGSLKGQHKGDQLLVYFKRLGLDLADTCGTVSVISAELRYQTP